MEFVDGSETTKTLAKIECALSSLGYWDSKDNPLKSKILSQFKALFGRAGLTRSAASMFDGLTAQIIRKMQETPKK